jgi:hypothetical protein
MPPLARLFLLSQNNLFSQNKNSTEILLSFPSKNVTFRPNGATSISVGQRPTNRIPLENKALKGRKVVES